MSEKNLWTKQRHPRGQLDGHFILPASDEEIMDAHPRCCECQSNDSEEFGIPWCYVNDERIDDENTDYCQHWSKKT